MRWRRSPLVLWRTAPNYLVLATADGLTVEVEGPAGGVWERLAEWRGEVELIGALARDYGADEQVVSRDVRSLLEELHARGYVDRDS